LRFSLEYPSGVLKWDLRISSVEASGGLEGLELSGVLKWDLEWTDSERTEGAIGLGEKFFRGSIKVS
jgi:hypothetical protein